MIELSATLARVPSDVRQDIADGIHQFYSLVDNGKAGSTADLFTDDARLTFGPGSPKVGTIDGAAIREAMAARELQASTFTRHVVANIMYAPASVGKVSVSYLLILFRSDDNTRGSLPAFVADVIETWAMHGSGWKLAERTINPTFSRG